MDTVGIVGGGRAGQQLFELFRDSATSAVAFVVDARPDAPAVRVARSAGVTTYSDWHQAIEAQRVRFLFEVTGSDEVLRELRASIDEGETELVPHQAAALMLTSIERNHRALTDRVVAEVESIQRQIDGSLSAMQDMVSAIEDVTGSIQMLAINARIEAARVGDQGRGFAVVASEMARSNDSIRQTASQLDALNAEIKAVSTGIAAALGRLAA